MTLAEVFTETQEVFESNKPEFLRLLESTIDLCEIVPVSFRNHFYSSTGRPREYTLISLLWALTLSSGMIKLRERYFSDGHVKDLITMEDILFSSSSAAADFVLGYSVSGPQMWKAKDGRSLKEIENENTKV